MGVAPTVSASNTREFGISCRTSALVIVLPAPWVPLIYTIMESNASGRACARLVGAGPLGLLASLTTGVVASPAWGCLMDHGTIDRAIEAIRVAGGGELDLARREL